jgi:anthranilate synthase component I
VTPICTLTLAADQVTPVRAYASLRSHAPQRSSFLLESVVPEERWGRYSIVGYRAQEETLYPAGDTALAHLIEDMSPRPAAPAPSGEAEDKSPNIALAERFAEALVGFIAYEAIGPLHRLKPWTNEGPVARMIRGATVVVFDNLQQTLTIAGPSKGAVSRCAWEMTHGPDLRPLRAPALRAMPEYVDVSMSDEAFMERVQRAKEYICAGDAFQVVLSRTFKTPLRGADPLDIYRALRVLSPSPYLYFLDFGATPLAPGLTIAGASPETMVRFEAGKMTLRPIAGTRPRGASAVEDTALAEELLADPKERAEHVMLIDLARNDVGRVCEPGSVEVTAKMEIERYSHVMHIVSEVVGTVKAGVSPGDVVKASFPAGTLSGAPKVRATEIIRELETKPRGVYGGALGYVMPDGTLDLAITIRTVVVTNGEVEVTAGAGIVEGSVPASEAEETRNKARAALAAIRAAQDAADEREAADEQRRTRERQREAAQQAEATEAAEAAEAPEDAATAAAAPQQDSESP